MSNKDSLDPASALASSYIYSEPNELEDTQATGQTCANTFELNFRQHAHRFQISLQPYQLHQKY